MKKCVNFWKFLLPRLNLFYMQTLKWILFERQNTPKEKKIYHNLIFYMNFSWEEKSLLRTLEGWNVQQQICFSVDHKNQTVLSPSPKNRFIMVHCRTLLRVGICHMAWQFNGCLILDKNKAQSFCKEFEFLDGSFPNNSCASKLSYSICNLWTQYSNIYKWAKAQITWAISSLQSLRVLAMVRVHSCQEAQAIVWTTRPGRQQWCPT